MPLLAADKQSKNVFKSQRYCYSEQFMEAAAYWSYVSRYSPKNLRYQCSFSEDKILVSWLLIPLSMKFMAIRVLDSSLASVINDR